MLPSFECWNLIKPLRSPTSLESGTAGQASSKGGEPMHEVSVSEFARTCNSGICFGACHFEHIHQDRQRQAIAGQFPSVVPRIFAPVTRIRLGSKLLFQLTQTDQNGGLLYRAR